MSIKDAGARVLDLLPHTPAGDYLHMLAYFVYAHRRLPRRDSGLLNDHIFFIKTGPEISDALRQVTSDKIWVKYFVDQVCGRPATPRTLAVFDSVEAVRRATLPDRCVLKPAHGNGGVVFVTGGRELTDADLETLRDGLEMDLYRKGRERNYKNLRKRILCEELVEAPETVKDYKVFCFGGEARLIQVDWSRHGLHKQNFYGRDWTPVEVTYNHNPNGEWEPRPGALDEMLDIAEAIAAHFGLVRVDFYLRGGRPLVGEITHAHNQGHGVYGSLDQERRVSRIIFG